MKLMLMGKLVVLVKKKPVQNTIKARIFNLDEYIKKKMLFKVYFLLLSRFYYVLVGAFWLDLTSLKGTLKVKRVF